MANIITSIVALWFLLFPSAVRLLLGETTRREPGGVFLLEYSGVCGEGVACCLLWQRPVVRPPSPSRTSGFQGEEL